VDPTAPGRDPVTGDAGPGWAWGAYLLEQIEETALAAAIDFDAPVWASNHSVPRRATITSYLCPSVGEDASAFAVADASGAPVDLGAGPIEVGRSHYVASHGQESCWGACGGDTTATIFTDIYTGAKTTITHNGDAAKVADGPFYRNSRTRFADVTDGLSKTIFFGEHSARLSDKTWAGVVPQATTLPKLETPDNGDDAAATLVLVHSGPSGGEEDPITGDPIIHPVNFPTLHVGQMFADHPGGGNVALGDASVRFVSEDVNLNLWAEYSSIGEGETSNDEL
jgi:hypothetical protein